MLGKRCNPALVAAQALPVTWRHAFCGCWHILFTFAFVLAFGGALALAHSAYAAPSLDSRAATLTAKEGRAATREALRERYTIRRWHRRLTCRRQSRLRLICRARWGDTYGTWYKATVRVVRTGTFGSPTTTYRADVRGDRNDAPRDRYSGTLPTPVRRAYVGQNITLASGSSSTVRVGLDVIDPARPLNEFSEPAAGSRYLSVVLALTNLGSRMFDDALNNDVRLALPNGGRLRPSYDETMECADADSFVKVPPGETHRGCVTFELPHGQGVTAVEVRLQSGDASELGRWYWR